MSTKISEKEKLLLGRIGVLNQEIERLHSIIKEVREYIKENTTSYYANTEETIEGYELVCDPEELLEILERDSDTKE